MNWSTMLQDGVDGSLSSRRVITFAAFLLCAAAFIANMFFGYKIDQFIFESMAYIAMAGLGFTVAEKFSSRSQSSNTPVSYNPNYQPTYTRVRGTPLPREEEPLI